jgi:hypothetical protein
MELMMDYIFTEDGEESNLHKKSISKTNDEPVSTGDEEKFSREKVKHTIENFNDKKAPGIDGIAGNIYLRVFNTFPKLVTEIYNQ